MFKIRLQKVFVEENRRHYIYAQIKANGAQYSTFTVCREFLADAINNLIYDYKWGWGFDKEPQIRYTVGQIEGIETLKQAWSYACEFAATKIAKIDCDTKVF